MRVIRQAKLHFKEGNSDKVYEVDLAEVGAGEYVVNFRYGRRGAALKESSKTTSPVGLAQAEALFNALEAEKRKKGYLTDGVAVVVPTADSVVVTDKPASREEAIERRLTLLAAGQNTFPTAWKPSKVIWMAGQLKLQQTVPSLLRLVERAGGVKGDDLQRYSTIWALGRCAGSPHDVQAIQTIQPYFTNPIYSDKVRRIAGESLLLLLTGTQRQAHLNDLINQLPSDVQTLVAVADTSGLTGWLRTQVLEATPPQADTLETLYSLAPDHPFARQPLLATLRQIPFRPGYFRAARHLLKTAELRDDFEVQGLLAYRFEKTRAFYSKPLRDYYSESENSDPPRYVSAIGAKVKVKAELKKPDSRLAYSNVTRQFMQKRLQTSLTTLGEAGHTNYVRLATAILISYDKATDYEAGYSHDETRWENVPGQRNKQYVTYTRYFPTYANAMLMNQILFGNSTRLAIHWNGMWAEKELRPQANNAVAAQQPKSTTLGVLSSLFGRVAELLGVQQTESATTPASEGKADVSVREEMYPNLWDSMPQAYVQLLLRARVDEIHAFAYRNLIRHPDYAAIEARIDLPMVTQLLQSPFEIPARWGVELIQKRLSDRPDTSLIALLLQSPVAEVRELGLQLTEQYADTTLTDPGFVLQLALSEHKNLRTGIRAMLQNRPLTPEQQQSLLGRTVAQLHLLTTNDELTNKRIRSVTDLLLAYASAGFANISEVILLDLIQIPVDATNELVVRLLKANGSLPSPVLLAKLVASPVESVRKLADDLVVVPPVQDEFNDSYKRVLLPELVFMLTHKETGEGVHQAAATFIRTYLTHVLPLLAMPEVLRLVYANYRPAQETGLLALSVSTEQANLTIRQVIALGNHDLLAARQWAVQFFYGNVPRIRYERDEAIRLLDAEWADTRQGAMQFFRDHYTADDWSPTTLIAIADSVRADIQAFGRELIGRFFTDQNGPEYLMKLSQHPGEAVQLFATNYLQRYATDQPERLRELAFYFRTVLMRAHRGRVAKDRVLAFLQQEGLKSEENARYVAKLLTEVSATSAIGDKASCLRILHRLQTRYATITVPFVRQEVAFPL
ncbi:WGR domain-containing protein [uncultured Fibrella sp.]|uniref:WGR domain-containing protein n=1 Tax=uncultured Fibrella sp. TaxID=1284596 RepID=UPI0035CBF1F4